MSTENIKTNEAHKFKLTLGDKIDIKNPERDVTLLDLSIYYPLRNIKSVYSNNKFVVSAPKSNYEFELPNESYSTENIQDYFEYTGCRKKKERYYYKCFYKMEMIDKLHDKLHFFYIINIIRNKHTKY